MKEVVIFVHGLWMKGMELSLLRRRVARCGFDTAIFRYPSLRHEPAANAASLLEFAQSQNADIVHFVGHSLGGLVLTHLFANAPALPPGRVVMLGTPLTGSATAVSMSELPLFRPFLGKSIDRGLLGDRPAWAGTRELGMIAGDRGFGVSNALFHSLDTPHDGTVALHETMSSEVNQHLRVPYSHFGMLYSTRVAESLCHFLKEGEFL